jgi:hypothetical protein
MLYMENKDPKLLTDLHPQMLSNHGLKTLCKNTLTFFLSLFYNNIVSQLFTQHLHHSRHYKYPKGDLRYTGGCAQVIFKYKEFFASVDFDI